MNIEKGIPIPERHNDGQITGVLRAMVAGDSIVVPKSRVPVWRSSAARIGIKVVSRQISLTECRLWRVK